MKKQLLVLFALVAVMGTNVQARSLKNDYKLPDNVPAEVQADDFPVIRGDFACFYPVFCQDTLQGDIDMNNYDLIKHDFCMFYGGIRPENLQICLIKSLRLNKDFAFVFSCGINDKRLGQLVVLSPNAPMQLKGRVEFKECDLKSNLIFVFYKDIDRQLNCEVEDNDFVIESMVCGEDKLMVYLPFKNE
ncbi:MAG TPA: hypothetical protein H9863_03240 [Candidatus Odoribacter faecigallinarum]|uniref:Uncharacterized protein n=1 Tax=Candidatus Odoribacter faecigallinarum TaxID=2838706 RepID=A0A9D2ABS4_9BACT|nr:hypothetical protein [Candidatus Odoribacter faecigallinarum]